MPETTKILIPHERLTDFCHRWEVTEMALFGSVLRDDFRPDSDVDILVSFAPDAHWSLFDLVRMEDELCDIFGRAVEQSENYIRRLNILSNMETIYAQG